MLTLKMLVVAGAVLGAGVGGTMTIEQLSRGHEAQEATISGLQNQIDVLRARIEMIEKKRAESPKSPDPQAAAPATASKSSDDDTIPSHGSGYWCFKVQSVVKSEAKDVSKEVEELHAKAKELRDRADAIQDEDRNKPKEERIGTTRLFALVDAKRKEADALEDQARRLEESARALEFVLTGIDAQGRAVTCTAPGEAAKAVGAVKVGDIVRINGKRDEESTGHLSLIAKQVQKL
ncbi:MAG TPA: hypothetical protein VG797_01485 [Phycisphaerales bacterium]|nr:hypothetical protein [Phycisphaerales bacterium]